MCYRGSYHRNHWNKSHRHQAQKWWKEKMANWGYPPVNVEEEDDQYVITLYAAGYEKSDFQVGLQDDTLIISVQHKKDPDEYAFDWTRQVFKPGNFERRFELNHKIYREAINAQYSEGVLKVILRKLDDFKTNRKDIEIV